MAFQLQDSSSPLAQIRRESLDIYNRLHSIAEDVDFVTVVHNVYADIPLIREYASTNLPASAR
jgi:tRNA A64-2'-O-ribosylphosphate transferase